MDSTPIPTAADFRLLLLVASPAQDPSIAHEVDWWNALAPRVGATSCEVLDLSSQQSGIDSSREGTALGVLLTAPDELDVRILGRLRSWVEAGASLLLSGPVAFPLVQAWLGPSAPPYRLLKAPLCAPPSLYVVTGDASPMEFPEAKWYVDTGCFVWRSELEGFLVRSDVEATPALMRDAEVHSVVAFGARRLGAGMLVYSAAPVYFLARTEAARDVLARALRAAIDAWRGPGDAQGVTPEARRDSPDLGRGRESGAGDGSTERPGTSSEQEPGDVPEAIEVERGDAGAPELNRIATPDSSWTGPWNQARQAGPPQPAPLTSPWFRLVARGIDGAMWSLTGSQVVELTRDVARTHFNLLADDKGNPFARYISSRHPLAEFRYIEGRWHVRVPEESPNGVVVDGVRVGSAWHPLVDGARIQPYSTRQQRSIAALELVAERGDA